MIEMDIPGFGSIAAQHLVLDYNGTLAIDGGPVAGVKPHLAQIARQMSVHVLTADTFGQAQEAMADVDCTVSILAPGRQDDGKLRYVQALGIETVVAVGNGRNDALMLGAARLGIAVILEEGASSAAVAAADIVCTDILSALSLLVNPLRLAATLRT